MTTPVFQAAPAAALAGFWRRIAAFLVDVGVLALAGDLLGRVFGDAFARLGAAGPLVGFVLAGAYFGVSHGRSGGGRTLGKRLLRLRVVAADGAPLPFARAAARYAVLGVPFFLGTWSAFAGPRAGLADASVLLLSLAVGEVAVYLLAFNRRTRQSLHDFAARSQVLRASALPPGRLAPAWRGHAVAAAAIVAQAAASVAVFSTQAPAGSRDALVALQRRLGAQPGVVAAAVTDARRTGYGVASEGQRRVFAIRVAIEGDVGGAGAQAERLVAIALADYPAAASADLVEIDLVHGFDIGLASRWESAAFAYAPAQWRDRIAAGVAG